MYSVEHVYNAITALAEAGVIKVLAPLENYFEAAEEAEISSDLVKLVDIIDNDNIPTWAKFLARDKNGRWYWYCRVPFVSKNMEQWVQGGFGSYTLATHKDVEVANIIWERDWKESRITVEEYRELLAGVVVSGPAGQNNAFENAPGWANYRATDANGGRYWYNVHPYKNEHKGEWRISGIDALAVAIYDDNPKKPEPNWRNTLVHRNGA